MLAEGFCPDDQFAQSKKGRFQLFGFANGLYDDHTKLVCLRRRTLKKRSEMTFALSEGM